MDFAFTTILNAILIGLLGFVSAIFLYIKRRHNYWESKGVPHVKATSLLFGNLKEVVFKKESMFEEQLKLYRKFENEPYCGYYEFHYPVLMLRDPQLIQTVLSENFNSFQEAKMVVKKNADEILDYTPFLQAGSLWKETRSILSAGLTPNKLRSLEEIMKTLSKDLFKFVDNTSNDIEVYNDLCSAYASEMVANYGWGIKSDGFSPVSKVKKMFDIVSFTSSLTFELMWLHPLASRLLSLRFFPKDLCQFLSSITDQASKTIQNNKSNSPTFLLNLVNIKEKRKSSGKDMPLEEMTGHMGTFFSDAYDTTARILGYIVYCTMLYPEMQEKLRNEILTLTEEVTIESLSKLPFMEMFISEVLRYHTILIYIGRVCTEKFKLGSLEVEPGTSVIIPNYSIHRDPKYFPNPDVFDPENFSEENKNNRHKFTYFPFGQGPRMCPGMRYATAVIKLFLYYILKNYNLTPPKDHPAYPLENDPTSKVVFINKNPMYIRLQKRS